MIEFLQHTPAEQRQAFLLTAQKKHLPEPSIEKDWWVTQILNLVFSLPIADQLVFKGGTSLATMLQSVIDDAVFVSETCYMRSFMKQTV